MHSRLQRTIDTLAASENPSAVDALAFALRSADTELSAAALAALLKKQAHRGNVEIIREFPALTADMRSLLPKYAAGLGRSIRQVLTQKKPELRRNALELLRWLGDCALIPVLVQLLETPDLPERNDAADALIELTSRLYEQIRAEPPSAEAQRMREQALAALEMGCVHFDRHGVREIVEAAIILSDADGPQMHKLCRESPQSCRECAGEILISSFHPGVMRIVVESMSQNFPLREIRTAFETREDPEFISHLLSFWPPKLSPNQQKNFREIATIPWLLPGKLCLETVPPGLHRQLVAFLLNTGSPLEQKLPVLEWMVRFGSQEGRHAATDVLVDLEDSNNKVTNVILEGLESEVPDVQAWATHQLRPRHIPDAFHLLIERLDSPMPEVREAARAELGDFNIVRALELYDHLDARLCEAVGRLVMKIDPQTPLRLRNELLQAVRRKRIRAARGALALRLHFEVADALLDMTHDSDNLVRRTAAEVLGHIATPESAARLSELLHDASPRVREAATAALRDFPFEAMHESSETESTPDAQAELPLGT
jgi:HEAT repeat protein